MLLFFKLRLFIVGFFWILHVLLNVLLALVLLFLLIFLTFMLFLLILLILIIIAIFWYFGFILLCRFILFFSLFNLFLHLFVLLCMLDFCFLRKLIDIINHFYFNYRLLFGIVNLILLLVVLFRFGNLLVVLVILVALYVDYRLLSLLLTNLQLSFQVFLFLKSKDHFLTFFE